jgi:acyl dehydratase/NAD(P)-dependent dehydrogenase (short-subunit alcohol dehydrogenase family)
MIGLPKHSHVVTQTEHEAFALLSGDHNPLHMNARHARRLLFGGTVTHGVHLLLRALETYAQSHIDVGALVTIGARFFSATHPGEPVTIVIHTDPDDLSGPLLRNTIFSVTDLHDRLVIKVKAKWRSNYDSGHPALPAAVSEPVCESLSDADIAHKSGTFPLFLNQAVAANLFPKLSAGLPALQLAALLGTTYVVGMRLPGHNSIFASLDLRFAEGPSDNNNDFRYATEYFCRERRFCRIAVSSPGMSGRLENFVRPNPVAQPCFSELLALVKPDLFAAQHALVVGGSRGLGEVCAKLLAAGWAEVTLTYREGAEDAQRVVAELIAGGAPARALCFDAQDQEPADLLALLAEGSRITGLYYFATPLIFTETKQFSYASFINFAGIYIGSVARLFETLTGPPNDGALRRVWLPSSVAVESHPEDMTAYIMAKQAMEYLAADWARKYEHIRFATPRLPRLATDQTVTLSPMYAEEPAPLLADLLTAFCERA